MEQHYDAMSMLKATAAIRVTPKLLNFNGLIACLPSFINLDIVASKLHTCLLIKDEG